MAAAAVACGSAAAIPAETTDSDPHQVAATIDATIRASLDASRQRSDELVALWRRGAEASDDPVVFLARALEFEDRSGHPGAAPVDPAATTRIADAIEQARDDPLALTMLAVHCSDAASKTRLCPAWSAAERLTAIESENGFNWLLGAIESDHARRGAKAQTAALGAAASASRFDSHWAEMLLRFFDFYRSLDRSVSTYEAVVLASDEVNRFALPPQYPWLFHACEVAHDDARRSACEDIAYQMAERATTMVDEAIGVALMKRLGGVARFGDELTRIDQHHRRLMAAEIDCPSWRGAPFETDETNRLGDAWIDALRGGGEIAAVEQAARGCGLEIDRVAPLPDAAGR